jgi:hypothetical protein
VRSCHEATAREIAGSFGDSARVRSSQSNRRHFSDGIVNLRLKSERRLECHDRRIDVGFGAYDLRVSRRLEVDQHPFDVACAFKPSIAVTSPARIDLGLAQPVDVFAA